MGKPLRVLIIEDSKDDALLTIRELKRGGYEPEYERVETAEAMRKALRNKPWDVILSDYQMPQFNGLDAIALLKETTIDIPLIIVSGAIGEEIAAECMRLGARDYVMKGNLSRLVSAVGRELEEEESRRQRKQAEVALRNSEGRLHTLVQTIPDIVWLKDKDGVYLSCNTMFARFFGAKETDIVGKTDYDFVDRELADSFREHDNEAIAAGKPTSKEDWITFADDGHRALMDTIKTPMYDAGGTLIGVLGIGRDTTNHKRAEEQLQQILDRLRKAVGTTIQVMVSAVEARDPYTSGHQIRSADLARAIATEMGLPQEKIDGLRMAGTIHDIGKLSVPAEILSKPMKLSELEFSLIKEHACRGFKILKDVESPWPLAEIVYQHHERMDGSGYPRQLKGDDILIEARILAISDVVEAMASHRPYRPGLGIEAALEEIEKNKGVLYDNTVADACLRLFREKGFRLEAEKGFRLEATRL